MGQALDSTHGFAHIFRLFNRLYGEPAGRHRLLILFLLGLKSRLFSCNIRFDLGEQTSQEVIGLSILQLWDLDKPLDTGDSKELCLADIIPDSNSQEGFEQALQTIADEHTREVLHKALDRLDKPLRDVIVLYYFEDMPQEQIAKREGVSGECIRQRKAKALRKLRNPVRSKRIRDFL